MIEPTRAALIRHDGSVLIPGAVAGEVLAAIVRDLTARAQRDGGLPTSRAAQVLFALHEAAIRHDETSGTGSAEATSATVNSAVTVTEAAALLECTSRWARHLAETGQIAARRTGRVWLIDADDLERFRRGVSIDGNQDHE